jgi:thioredoxin reductase
MTLVGMNEHDVVIVGGGAAGLSAALVLSRARRTVLVIDSGAPRNAPASHMHGFLSRDGMPPAELLAAGRAEVTGYGGRVVTGTVTDVTSCESTGFHVLLADGTRVTGRRLLLATGLGDELPDIPGIADRWARDVLHCPYCHGYEVRDRRLGVLGWTPGAARYAQIVRQWSDDVVYFTAGELLTATDRAHLIARQIAVVDGSVARILVDDDRLTGIETTGGRTVARDALFVPPRFRPHNALIHRLGARTDEDGWVATGSTGRTSVPGLWVAGNLSNPRAQVITAAGEGSAAAIDINADLVDDDVRQAVRDAGHGLLA